MAVMHPRQRAFLREAVKYVDRVHESPPKSNRTELGVAYHLLDKGRPDGEAWCDKAVSVIARRAGIPTSVIPNSAYVPSRWAQARQRKWTTNRPQPGDLVIFDFPTKTRRADGVPDHIGILEDPPRNGHIVTLEGNTSSDEHGSQDDGDGYYRKRRSTTLVAGYIRPPWAAGDKLSSRKVPVISTAATVLVAAVGSIVVQHNAAPPRPAVSAPAHVPAKSSAKPPVKPAVKPAPKPPAKATVKQVGPGAKGPIVRVIQRKVGAAPDGDYGPGTRAKVKAWQAKHRLTADGVVGPMTAKAMGITLR